MIYFKKKQCSAVGEIVLTLEILLESKDAPFGAPRLEPIIDRINVLVLT